MNLVEGQDDCAGLILVEAESCDTEFSLLMLILKNREISTFNKLTDGSQVEELEIVLKGNEEHTILSYLTTKLLSEFWCPLG